MNKDTKYIQDLLDKCGDVFVPGGIYNIDETLKIHDNTHLKLAHDAVLRLADHAHCEIMANDKLARDYNENITVEGGIFDGNNLNQERDDVEHLGPLTRFHPEYYYGVMMRFVGVKNLRICDLTMKDPHAYPVQISMVHHFTVENIKFDYNMACPNMDGIHVNGPACDGMIRNLHGATNDDMVALNCDDCYETEITSGIIENVLVDGLFCENGYTAVRLLSCGHQLRNVSIRNIYGSYRFNAVSFTHHSVHAGDCWLDNVTIDGVYATKSDPANDYALIWFAAGTHTGRVTLRNIHRVENTSSEAPTIKIDRGATVERLLVEDVTQHYNSGSGPELLSNSGEVACYMVR